MKTSESIKEIAGALAKAQAHIEGAKKDRENPHFRSKFADLASVWDACRKALTDEGLSVVQMTEPSEKNEVVVITRLCHLSGEWIEGVLALPVSKADAQGFGSALTYARRYALAAAVGVAPEDDDGNLAAAAKPSPADVYINKDRPNNGAQVSKDAFESLDDGTKDYLNAHARTIIGLFEGKGDIAGYIRLQDYDVESKLALWSLLPSNVRSEIKRQQAKPSLAEQG